MPAYRKAHGGMAIVIPDDVWRDLVSELGWQLVLSGIYDATDTIEADVVNEIIRALRDWVRLAVDERKMHHGSL